ncbi:MAG: transporter [Nitrospiraceae bacterium]|nr:transporter [Nitrospiraceae bacterium]
MRRILFFLGMVVLTATSAYAGHPLITDDAATQGKGKGQIEIGSQYSTDKQPAEEGFGSKTRTGQVTATFTYGPIDGLDIVVGVPYQWSRTYLDGQFDSRAVGFGDLSFDLKWRFYEKDGWGFALKPGVTLPTGNSGKGLGTGRTTYHLYGIVTKEMEPWAFHLNLGYIRNENKTGQEKNIWHASVAAEVEVIKSLKAVADVVVEENTTKGSNTPVTYALGGLVYAITDKLSIDGGVKFGLTKPSADVTYLLGVTYRF